MIDQTSVPPNRKYDMILVKLQKTKNWFIKYMQYLKQNKMLRLKNNI